MLNSSPRWFSSGVPVSVIVKSRSTRAHGVGALRGRRSSRTAPRRRRPWRSDAPRTSRCAAGAGRTRRRARRRGRARRDRASRSSLNQRVFRLGMKRASSAIQFDDTEAGAMMSCGPSDARAFKTAAVCTVFPSPMSSARMQPGRPGREPQHPRHALALVGTQRAVLERRHAHAAWRGPRSAPRTRRDRRRVRRRRAPGRRRGSSRTHRGAVRPRLLPRRRARWRYATGCSFSIASFESSRNTPSAARTKRCARRAASSTSPSVSFTAGDVERAADDEPRAVLLHVERARGVVPRGDGRRLSDLDLDGEAERIVIEVLGERERVGEAVGVTGAVVPHERRGDALARVLGDRHLASEIALDEEALLALGEREEHGPLPRRDQRRARVDGDEDVDDRRAVRAATRRAARAPARTASSTPSASRGSSTTPAVTSGCAQRGGAAPTRAETPWPRRRSARHRATDAAQAARTRRRWWCRAQRPGDRCSRRLRGARPRGCVRRP